MYSRLERREIILNYFYNFINGFFLMRQIPQIWYVLKMAVGVFVTVAITFAIAVMVDDSWVVISIGSYVMVGIIVFYGFRIGMYWLQKRKNKIKKL